MFFGFEVILRGFGSGDFQGHALHADGTLSYFGFPNGSNPTTFAPPAGLAGVKALDEGREVSLLLRNDGSLTFIGSNQEQQITGVLCGPGSIIIIEPTITTITQ